VQKFLIFIFFLFYAYFLNICISYESSHIIFSKVSVAGRRVKRLKSCENFRQIKKKSYFYLKKFLIKVLFDMSFSRFF
jgi:hypothetical protein